MKLCDEQRPHRSDGGTERRHMLWTRVSSSTVPRDLTHVVEMPNPSDSLTSLIFLLLLTRKAQERIASSVALLSDDRP